MLHGHFLRHELRWSEHSVTCVLITKQKWHVLCAKQVSCYSLALVLHHLQTSSKA